MKANKAIGLKKQVGRQAKMKHEMASTKALRERISSLKGVKK